MSDRAAQPLAYIEAVYENVRAWYENADRKAQVVLALDGAFLSLIAGGAFSKASDVQGVVGFFGQETVVLLALMALSLVASILCAIACLFPRLRAQRDPTQPLLEREAGRPHSEDALPAEISWFFGHLAQLDAKRVTRALQQVDDSLAARAMASQVALLSQNVRLKHEWVDRAFLFAGSSLVFFLLAAASYVVRVWASEMP